MKTTTSWTQNQFLEENGYLVLKNLYDAEKLFTLPSKERGLLHYWGKKEDQVQHIPVEHQVEGSLSRYWHPKYRQIHGEIKKTLEKKLGRDLYNTYYFDRFYFPGQELKKHKDRDACEISVTVHISTNLKGKDSEWPIWIETPKGEERSVILKPGDGMVYKGCEQTHWRNPMPGKFKFWKRNLYYHQIFFHYVLQDGIRSHYAFDGSRDLKV